MVVDEDVAAQHFRERLQAEVALRRIALMRLVPLVPLTAVSLRLNPRRAIAGDVAHPRRRAAVRIYALRILAARHLEPVLRAGKLHSLCSARGNDFENDAASADEVRRAWEHLKGRDAAR